MLDFFFLLCNLYYYLVVEILHPGPKQILHIPRDLRTAQGWHVVNTSDPRLLLAHHLHAALPPSHAFSEHAQHCERRMTIGPASASTMSTSVGRRWATTCSRAPVARVLAVTLATSRDPTRRDSCIARHCCNRV